MISGRTIMTTFYKSITFCAFFLSALLCGAQELLPDPGCEQALEKKGKLRLRHIAASHHSKSSGTGGIESKVIHSGKYGAFLEKTNPSGWAALHVAIPQFKASDENRKMKIELFLKGELIKSGSVVLTGDTGFQRQYLWEKICSFKGSFDWKKFSGTVIVPAGVSNAALSIRLDKPGKLYADDLSVKWENISGPLLFNPGFENGIDKKSSMPRGWIKRDFEGWETESAVVLDAPGRSSRHAVKIFWKSGGSKSGLQTPFMQCGKNRKFTLSCDFKSTAGSPGGCMVEFFDRNGKAAGSSVSPAWDTPVWQKRKYIFSVPDKAEKFRVILMLQGNGGVWYDNVSLKSSAEAAVADFPISGKVVSVNASSVWNKGKEVFNTFTDTPCQLTFAIKGYRQDFRAPALTVELPAGFVIAECFELHTDLGGKVIPETCEILRNGEKYTRFTFRKSRIWSIIQPGFAWSRCLTMAVMPRQTGFTGKAGKVYWYFENNGKKGSENCFELNILPPLAKIRLPENFSFGFWNSSSMDFPTRKIADAVAEKYERCNIFFRQRVTARKKYDDILKKRNWQFSTASWTADYAFRGKDPTGYFRVPGYKKICGKMRYRMMRDGSLHTGKLCPEYFLRDADYNAFAATASAKRLQMAGCQNGDIVFLDSEPWGPMNWCFDEACRKAFAAFAGLKKTPEIAGILKNHQDKWLEFRVKQSTETVARLASFIRKAYPDVKIIDYDYPMPLHDKKLMKAHLRSCSKDPLLNEEFIDGHMASYYHTLNTREFDMISTNMRHLKKPYHVILAIEDHDSYLSRKEILSPRQFRQHMTAAAVLGAKGVWVYSNAGSETDGRYFQEIQNGMADIAVLEPFIRAGRADDRVSVSVNGSTDLKKLPVRFCAYKKNGELLICIFNYDTEKSFPVLISCGDRITKASDALTGRIIPHNNGKIKLSALPVGSYFLKAVCGE